MIKKRIIIIGGGAAGLASAVKLSSRGLIPVILDSNHVMGRKLLASGAGKCNLSNSQISPEHYNKKSAGFLKKTFAELPPKKVLAFFKDLGLFLKTEDDGEIFPLSEDARDVKRVLIEFLKEKKAEMLNFHKVHSVSAENGGFKINVFIEKPKWADKNFKKREISFACEKLILACGGAGYSKLGGTRDGYRLAEDLGLKTSPIFPGLTPLTAENSRIKDLKGIRIWAGISFSLKDKILFKKEGEVLFSDYGISGPAVLSASGTISPFAGKKKIICGVNFLPRIPFDDFLNELLSRKKRFSQRPLSLLLAGILSEKISNAVIPEAGFSLKRKIGDLTELEIKKIALSLTEMKFEISGTKSFENAMVTLGGIDLSLINPETFQSTKNKNLFAVGELLDVDGESGGYNLHFAWTSGILAGSNVRLNQYPHLTFF